MEQAITIRQQQSIMQPLDTDIIIHQYKELQRLYKSVMQEQVHYGAPFPGSEKKSLLKPGAELVCALYQLDLQTDNIRVEDLGNGHREYVVTSVAYHRPSGMRVGSGNGSASTMESKYRYRNAQLRCPECRAESVFKDKKGSGWYCWAKKGGCGAKFKGGDKRISEQPRGKVENPDIADQYNTVLKMAKKRSAIDCVLWSTAASSFFTQDGEDQKQYSEKDFPEVKVEWEPADPGSKNINGEFATDDDIMQHEDELDDESETDNQPTQEELETRQRGVSRKTRDLILQIAQSHVFTDDEKAKAQKTAESDKLTRESADEWIQWLNTESTKRKKAEKADAKAKAEREKAIAEDELPTEPADEDVKQDREWLIDNLPTTKSLKACERYDAAVELEDWAEREKIMHEYRDQFVKQD